MRHGVAKRENKADFNILTCLSHGKKIENNEKNWEHSSHLPMISHHCSQKRIEDSSVYDNLLLFPIILDFAYLEEPRPEPQIGLAPTAMSVIPSISIEKHLKSYNP